MARLRKLTKPACKRFFGALYGGKAGETIKRQTRRARSRRLDWRASDKESPLAAKPAAPRRVTADKRRFVSVSVMLQQFLRGEFRPVPSGDASGEIRGLRFCRVVMEQLLDGRLDSGGRVFGLGHPYREPEPLQTGEVCDLLHLHAHADDRLTAERGGHDRADAAVDDREVGDSVHLKRRNPVGDENIRGYMRARNLFKLELYRSDDPVRLALEALDDSRDDLARARASAK